MATPLHPIRFLTMALAAMFASVTPADADSFVDNEFVTYDQDTWGGTPAPLTAAGLLHGEYDSVYASSGGALHFGIFPTGNYLEFTNVNSLQAYLPAFGAPAALNTDLVDTTSSSAGIFGGQVAALRLNIDFSDFSLLTHPAGAAFGDLVLTGFNGSLAGVDGLTVRQLQDIANTLLGGQVQPYSIADISGLVTNINDSFQGGFAERSANFDVDRNFVLPITVMAPVPEPSIWLLMLISLSGWTTRCSRAAQSRLRGPAPRH